MAVFVLWRSVWQMSHRELPLTYVYAEVQGGCRASKRLLVGDKRKYKCQLTSCIIPSIHSGGFCCWNMRNCWVLAALNSDRRGQNKKGGFGSEKEGNSMFELLFSTCLWRYLWRKAEKLFRISDRKMSQTRTYAHGEALTNVTSDWYSIPAAERCGVDRCSQH